MSGPKAKPKGVSLLELVLVMGMVALLFAVTHIVLNRTIDTWWRVNAKQESDQQLYRAQQSLERDLRAAAFEQQPDRATIAVESAPTQLVNLSGADGDVLWFLSAIDPVTGEFRRNPDGTPLWQRNILYYLVTPSNHAQHFGYQDSGLAVSGYEVACPFKLLIRKEIDAQKLLSFADLAPYLNRPDGYDCAGMATSDCTVKPVAANLLSFRVGLRPELSGVAVDLRATALERARREGGISNRDLSEQPFTTQLQFVVMPPNRPPTTP